MKAFASWSGGKDCMLAVHRFLKEPANQIHCLVNMCDSDGIHSRSHGVKSILIKNQAGCMGIPIMQMATDSKEYTSNFKRAMLELKKEGVNAGVFGDIYLQEHRTWIEQVCSEVGVDPVFPLWENDTKELLKEFVAEGFETIVVAIDNSKLSLNWLGRTIDNDFVAEIIQLEDIDACAEKGEYHSFVYNGPLFKKPLVFQKGEKQIELKSSFIEIKL